MKDKPLHYVLDEFNRTVPADLVAWAHFFENNNRIVDYTGITSDCHVSTVFIGLDLRPWHDGPPLLFETIVFRGDDSSDYGRYSSWDDAVTGHKAVVRKLRSTRQT